MGRSIVYCGDCGTFLREQDFETGGAREIDRRPFCSRCRPSAPPAAPKRASRASTGHVPKIGTTRRPVPRRSSRAPVLTAVAVLVVLVLGAAGMAAGSARPKPKPVPAEAKEMPVPPRGTFSEAAARSN